MVQLYYVPMIPCHDTYFYISCRVGPAVALKSWGPLRDTEEGNAGLEQSA